MSSQQQKPSAPTNVAEATNRKSRFLGGLLTWSATLHSPKVRRNPKTTAAVQESIPVDVSPPKKDKGSLGLSTIYEPPDETVIVEVIFIHGLGGGSIKTWSDSSAGPATCWPRDWLPFDPDFEHVRIHTYGYEADWRERTPSILSVHDFAQSLLGEMRNHQLIRKSPTRIILVGHSMGGCVAKKTYILARQDPTCEDFASRFHSIFFLATPHRGSDLGKVLRNVLLLAGVSKPYVKDLVANSAPVKEVNDTFRQFAPELSLWSFFESLPISEYLDTLVVDKFSATLGYDNEEILFMDADHRRVCKFKHQSDHNYRKLRNALSRAIDMVKIASPTVVLKSKLGSLLGVNDSFEEDLAMLQETRLPVSCGWLMNDAAFSKWAEWSPESPSIYWLIGMPGAGKSVACSHVVDNLRCQTVACSYFFFKRGNLHCNINSLLINLAFQMAVQDLAVARRVINFHQEFGSFEGQSHRSVWRTLYLENIFKVDLSTNHFWVIDALDESPEVSEIIQLLHQVPRGIRIFLTSRNIPEISRGVASLHEHVYLRQVSVEDTTLDILATIRARLEKLSHLHTSGLTSKILEKSSGSFLWVHLVLKELEMAFTDEDIDIILTEVPKDLHEMYSRILGSIESDKRRVKLAQSIISWVTLAVRPMTVEELGLAVKLDINQSPQQMHQAITIACGQLLNIDQSGRVQLVHETAREVLLSTELHSELAVIPNQGHGRIAALCLTYLIDILKAEELMTAGDKILLRYAADFFSLHLAKSTLDDPVPRETLLKFLNSNVLSWIENAAQRQNLGAVLRTANDLQTYIGYAKMQHFQPDQDLTSIKNWATDISRIVLTFRSQLLKSPSAIHKLIPGFCPATSAMAKTVSTEMKQLTVIGQQGTTWHDCLVCIEHKKSIQTLACGKSHLAIGFSNGVIAIYEMVLFQQVTDFEHPERCLKTVEFGGMDKYLAASGADEIVIWSLESGEIVTRLDRKNVLSFCFAGEWFISATAFCVVTFRNMETDDLETYQWKELGEYASKLMTGSGSSASKGASLVAFDRARPKRVAVCLFGSSNIYIFNTSQSALAGVCSSSASIATRSMAFNPSPDHRYLVASDIDGSLVLFNSSTQEQLYIQSNVFASQVSWTTDGSYMIVGTGESEYTIGLYQITSLGGFGLNLIHQIDHPGISFTSLRIACLDNRLISSHSYVTRIWELPLAIRSSIKPSKPEADSGSDECEEAVQQHSGVISVMALSNDGQTVVCGNKLGVVSSFSAVDSSLIAILHNQHDCTITSISLAESPVADLVITCDESGWVIIAEAGPSKRKWSSIASTVKNQPEFMGYKALVSPSKDRMLMMSMSNSELWELPSGKVINSIRIPRASSFHREATQCPLIEGRFIIFEDSLAHLFRWQDFERTAEGRLVLSRDGHLPKPEDASIVSYLSNESVFVEKLADPLTGFRLNCWDTKSLHTLGDAAEVIPRHGLQHLNYVLGDIVALFGTLLVFLDRDRWICTADLDTFAETLQVKRHFFIFPEWVNLCGEVICVATPTQDLVIASRRNITVFRGWLEISETIPIGHVDIDAEFERYQKDEFWTPNQHLR